ncbi:MAG: hypothetical protein ACU833_12880 [Gammaproteobacteria bacterium]
MKRSFIMVWGALFLSSAAFSTLAEVRLNDKSELVGVWQVVATTPYLDHEKKETDETWEFKNNGQFELSAIDYRLNSTKMTTTTTYVVENGQLKIEKPGGQPGQKKKYYYYKVHEKEGNNMVLKGGMEGYYFLIKK